MTWQDRAVPLGAENGPGSSRFNLLAAALEAFAQAMEDERVPLRVRRRIANRVMYGHPDGADVRITTEDPDEVIEPLSADLIERTRSEILLAFGFDPATFLQDTMVIDPDQPPGTITLRGADGGSATWRASDGRITTTPGGPGHNRVRERFLRGRLTDDQIRKAYLDGDWDVSPT